MEPKIGSVVMVHDFNEPVVITGMKSYEDFGSCSLSRDYYVMLLRDIETKDYIKENEGVQIEVRGTSLPFVIVEDIAPFKIIKEVRYKVERMVPKVVTIYE